MWQIMKLSLSCCATIDFVADYGAAIVGVSGLRNLPIHSGGKSKYVLLIKPTIMLMHHRENEGNPPTTDSTTCCMN